MKRYMRTLSMLLILAIALSLGLGCMPAAAAAEAASFDPVSYKFYHSEMDALTYDAKSLASLKNKTTAAVVEDLYARKETKLAPAASNFTATSYVCHDTTAEGGTPTYAFDGLLTLKCKVGDWMAVKFISPVSGLTSISLDMYYFNANCSGILTAYLLPGNTDVSAIASKLSEDTKLGKAEVSNAKNKVELSRIFTYGTELEANEEYLFVIQITEDLERPDGNRVDLMLTGLTFKEGFEQGKGAFDPVSGQIVQEDILKSAQFYRAINGVNPANGHDLMYLLFKGSYMLVYDMDTKEMVDLVNGTHSTPFGQCFDPEGNLWICGAGQYIYKYDPATKEGTKYNFSPALFGNEKTNGYGLVYGDDGYLYFGYWGWLGRLNPKTGEVINLSGQQLTTDPSKESDAQFAGHGGIVYKDGYLYLNIFGDLNGDMNHTSQLIKYDLSARKIVDHMDISAITYDAHYGIPYLSLVGDLLIGSSSGRAIPLFVDVSGEKMVQMDTLEGLDSYNGVSNCFVGRVSNPIDGIVYIAGFVDAKESGRCIYAYDPETKTATRMSEILFLNTMTSVGGTATIDDPRLPGTCLVTPMNNTATGMVDLVFYSPETKATVIWDGITEGYGSGMDLRAVAVDPTGRYIYVGAYGTNLIAWYDTETGKTVVKPGYDHQTDGLFWYKDTLWVGNYSTGAITRFDPETYEAQPIVKLMDTVFQQKRMFALTAADNKVFCAPIPDTSRVGGALVWYDMESDLTYVAAGPEQKDVFYARTTGSFMVWRDVLTNTVQTFDEDGDGVYDFDFILDDKGDDNPANDEKQQRFYGVVPNQCIAQISYKDGYIYGVTTRAGGQAAVITPYTDNAQLFVYDVKNTKLVSTCDLADYIPDLENPETGYIDYIYSLQEDPYEEGKFWGVVGSTLFSCNYDFDTHQFTNVKEEVSFEKKVGKNTDAWKGLNILFDGDYLFATFLNYGIWMINTSDPTEKYQISSTGTTEMRRGADGNIYYCPFQPNDATRGHLMVFSVAELTQPLIGSSVQAVIDALPETVTMDNEAQVMAVYRMYEDLVESTKAQINTDKLDAALSALETGQAAKADALISAIGTITPESEAAVHAARNYFDSLPATTQEKVAGRNTLEAAEAALQEQKLAKAKSLLNPSNPGAPGTPDTTNTPANNNTGVFIIIAVIAVLLAAALVAVLLLRKRRT